MKNLVFPRIFLHCVALGFIVSGLLLSEGSDVRIVSGVPLRNDLWMSGDRASASTSTAKVFLRSKSQPLSLGCDFVFLLSIIEMGVPGFQILSNEDGRLHLKFYDGDDYYNKILNSLYESAFNALKLVK